MGVRCVLPALLATIASSVVAQDDGFSWHFGGFGTLGAGISDHDNIQYVRDISQPNGLEKKIDARLDSRLGLQGSVNVGERFQAVVQAVSKYQYDSTYAPKLTWAFLGWNPMDSLKVRGGRLGFDVFMNADSRDVGYSYLWARPSVDFYGMLPISHVDGLDVTYQPLVGGENTFKLKAFYGFTNEKVPSQQGQPPLDLKGGKLGGVIGEFQTISWRFRLAYAQFKLRHDLEGPVVALIEGLNQSGDPRLKQTAESLRFQDKKARFYSAGVSYENGPVQSQVMAAKYKTDMVLSPSYWAGFVSFGYRLGQVVPYAYWSRLVSDRPEAPLYDLPSSPAPQAQELVGGVRRLTSANYADQYTLGAGLRWDFCPKACFKLQSDRIQTKNSTGLWRNPLMDTAKNNRVVVVSAAFDFTF